MGGGGREADPKTVFSDQEIILYNRKPLFLLVFFTECLSLIQDNLLSENRGRELSLIKVIYYPEIV